MFRLKGKTLDHINGFSLALLAAMPVLRNDIIGGGPVYLLIFPSFLLIAAGLLKIFADGTKVFKVNTVTYYYFICLLFLYLFMSTFWNINQVSVTTEAAKILFLIIIATSVILTFNIRSSHYFLKWIIFFATITTFLLISNYVRAGNLRGYLDIAGYLTRSQLIGLGALSSYSLFLYFPDIRRKTYGFLTFLLFTGLAISLARGALVVGVFLAILLTAYYFKINSKKSYSLTEWFKNKSFRILAGGFIVFVIFAATQIERTARRLQLLLTGDIGAREDLWMSAIIGSLEYPIFGYGLGNSGIIVSGDPTYYPHNLFLQLLLDGGLIAFMLLFAICMYPIAKTYQLYERGVLGNQYIWIPILASFTFLLFEFSKSSNFYDARVFIALGLVLVIVLEELKEKATK